MNTVHLLAHCLNQYVLSKAGQEGEEPEVDFELHVVDASDERFDPGRYSKKYLSSKQRQFDGRVKSGEEVWQE